MQLNCQNTNNHLVLLLNKGLSKMKHMLFDKKIEEHRPLPKRGQVKTRIVAIALQSLAAMITMAATRRSNSTPKS